MQIKEWRVIWYETAGHEIGTEDFFHESDAHRAMARAEENRLARSAELLQMRRTAEAEAMGLLHDGWDSIKKRSLE